jgi:hypothetical protein
MIQADSVHSTPRKTASKIKVKKLAKPPSTESQEQRDLHHGEAFRDLETPMNELGAMVELMTQSMVDDYRAKLEQKAVA